MLDGFIAGPHDEIRPLFGWYIGGDTDFPVPGTPLVFKISRASAEIYIDLAPILLGAGIRLFDPLGPDPINMENLGVIQGSGVTHLRFRVAK